MTSRYSCPISLLPRAIADVTKRPAPSPRKIYELVLRGTIPAEYSSGRWRFDPMEVEEIARVVDGGRHHSVAA